MGKAWDWLHDDDDDHPIHHVEDPYAWAYEDDGNEYDESYADEDRVSSRPWGDDNNG